MFYRIRVYRDRHEFPFPIQSLFLGDAIKQSRACTGEVWCRWWSVEDTKKRTLDKHGFKRGVDLAQSVYDLQAELATMRADWHERQTQKGNRDDR